MRVGFNDQIRRFEKRGIGGEGITRVWYDAWEEWRYL